jgi:hypothetical protein
MFWAKTVVFGSIASNVKTGFGRSRAVITRARAMLIE